MFWNTAKVVAEKALENQSLLPIATDSTKLIEQGVEFHINIINSNILKKISTSKTQGNPFLPYDQDMFVATVGERHVCLLNKFPVLSPHILICSNEFVEQRTPLSLLDFEAWCQGFSDGDELGFYNGGKDAGASQPHRHMQLVKGICPLDKAYMNGRLGFAHKLYKYDQLEPGQLFENYVQGMLDLGLYREDICPPYNLLLTKNWFAIIPRIKAKSSDVFLNGLNYAGYFLLKSEEQLSVINEVGCVQILKACSED